MKKVGENSLIGGRGIETPPKNSQFQFPILHHASCIMYHALVKEILDLRMTFDRKPLIEDKFCWKLIFSGRQTLTKTTFDERQSLKEDNHQWRKSYHRGHHLMEEKGFESPHCHKLQFTEIVVVKLK